MKHVILVEDDEPIRDVIQLFFQNSGYELLNLENGDEIIDNVVKVPDLFILDKQLSGVDGLDICRYIKSSEKFKDVPVVMLSANPHIMLLAKEAGADSAIAKPFSLKQLRQTLDMYLA